MRTLPHHRTLTLLCLTLIITTISIAACGTPKSGIEWREPALEALVRQKLEKPKGVITQDDLDDIWGIELFGESHIFFNADGGYEMYKSDSDYDYTNYNCAFSKDNIIVNKIDNGEHYLKDGTYSVGEEQHMRGSISSLSDFANFRNLKYLYVYKNSLVDLSGLSSLEDLTELKLVDNEIRDISVLSELKQIDSLDLLANQVEDVSQISNLSQLTQLRLRENQISSIDAVASLYNLKMLNLSSNPFSSLESLKELDNLNYLWLTNTSVNDISILTGKVSISGITMSYLNAESIDVAPLGTLENLRSVLIQQDKAALVNYRELGKLEYLLFLEIKQNVNLTNEDIAWLKNELKGCDIQ